GSKAVSFHFNSSGTTGGNSHGTDIAAPEGTVTLSSDGNVDGRWLFDSSLVNIANSQAISATNKQSTKLTVDFNVVGQIPASVRDGFTDRACGGLTIPTSDCPTTFFGQTSDVNVNNDFHY